MLRLLNALIHDIKPAAEIVKELWDEFLEVKEKMVNI
jgi:hypothetical protein